MRSRGCRKVLALEDVHKYLPGEGVPWGSSLLRELADTARVMRHEDLRIVISTQVPQALHAEFLEYVSAAIIHRINAPEWLNVLSNKIPASSGCSKSISGLDVGEAVVASTKFNSIVRKIGVEDGTNDASLGLKIVKIRPRITRDYGNILW